LVTRLRDLQRKDLDLEGAVKSMPEKSLSGLGGK
jgi:hypothetical protein